MLGRKLRTGASSFVLEVPLRYLRPSIIYFVPCDRILQRTYCSSVSCKLKTALPFFRGTITKIAYAIKFEVQAVLDTWAKTCFLWDLRVYI